MAELDASLAARVTDASSPVAGLLQRMCDCGEHASGGECAECREEREHETLQRAPATLARPAIAPPIVHGVLRESGRPLDAETRADMEARLGCDFADVRVHADARAAGSARAVGALAYTVGSHVVFGSGGYAPASGPGRRLLAHELAHVAQQRTGSPAGRVPDVIEVGAPDTSHEHAAERAAEGVDEGAAAADELAPDARAQLQRRVAPAYPTIKDRLTYHFTDWAITDEDAHEVLVILRGLSEADMADTVAAMERDGLVDRLFSNVSDDDKAAEGATLQRVQNNRVFIRTRQEGATTVEIIAVDSCSPERQSSVQRALQTAMGWLGTAVARLQELVATPASERAHRTAASLRTHFHTASAYHAGLVAAQLDRVRTGVNGPAAMTVQCAAPTDPTCQKRVLAYARRGTPPVMRWCALFFERGAETQATTIIHESAHVLLRGMRDVDPGVTDRGYYHERVYEYLRPEEAMTNADSYAVLARELGTGREERPEQAGRPRDDIADCPRGSPEMIRTAIARVGRRNQDAVTYVGDARPVIRARWADLRIARFGNDDASRIQKMLDLYRDAQDQLVNPIDFECEEAGGACSGDTFGYFRRLIHTFDTLHLCPRWFGIPEPERLESLHMLVLRHAQRISPEDAARYAGLATDISRRRYAPPPPLPAAPPQPAAPAAPAPPGGAGG